MADNEHVAILNRGVEEWNSWIRKNPSIKPNLNGADLSGRELVGILLGQADLRNCNLDGTILSHAHFNCTDLSGSTIRNGALLGANFLKATMRGVDLSGAQATASFVWADLTTAVLRGANLHQANFDFTLMNGADFSSAIANQASFYRSQLIDSRFVNTALSFSNFAEANLTNADLTNADLRAANLVHAQLDSANLTGAHVYGVSVWGLSLRNTIQRDLVITNYNQPVVTVDNLEMAQFLYLMINNERIRDVIDAITSKVVLILGRFTEERKAILDVIRDELRGRGYLPVLFDFEGPENIDTTDTVLFLARMARFIIADLTDPKSVGHELGHIIPSTRIAIQPLLLKGQSTYSMFHDLARGRTYVLPIFEYEDVRDLVNNLNAKVISPAEECVSALRN